MDGLFLSWQMTALVSCVLAGGAMTFFFFKYASARVHPGPVLMCIFLSGCIANITRVLLHSWQPGDNDNGEGRTRLQPMTLSDIANTELGATLENHESYEPFLFWCCFFFTTSATMWFLMLALDLIFSLSNPFLPFNADNLKHHIFAWPAALLWCVLFRYVFVNQHDSGSNNVMLYYYLPSYLVLVYISGALMMAWRKSRRLETHAHMTTRRMAKLILPYLGVFAVDTTVTFILYVLELSIDKQTTSSNAIDQLTLVLETLAVFVLFCRDAGVFRAMHSDKDSPMGARMMGQTADNSSTSEKARDVSSELRMSVMKYMSMGIQESIKQAKKRAEEDEAYNDIQMKDYHEVATMSVIAHGKKASSVHSFHDVAPKVFHSIRELFKIDADFVKESFDTSKLMSEHGSEGKSGNIFYFTANKQFMVKSVPKEEFDTLRAILPHYHRYLLSNPQSMLCRYFGCHSISLPVGTRRMYFVVMQNLFNEGPVHQRFDLKGNRDRRQAINASQVESYIHLARDRRNIPQLMMDIDFLKLSAGIALSYTNAATVQGQLCDDIVFLASRGIIDYSILLGVRHLSPGERLPSIGAQSQGIYANNLENIYYIGIVDMLQRYSWRWTVQRWFLGLICKDTRDVSAVRPVEYGTRLSDFVRTRLFDIDGVGASNAYRGNGNRRRGSNNNSSTTPYIPVASSSGSLNDPDHITIGLDQVSVPPRSSGGTRDLKYSMNSMDYPSSFSPSVGGYSSVGESPMSSHSSSIHDSDIQRARKPSFFV